MTPQEVRAEAIRRVSVALAQVDTCRCEPYVFTDQAARLVDALGDLLPTGQEFQPGAYKSTFDGTRFHIENDPMQCRYVTAWKDIPE